MANEKTSENKKGAGILIGLGVLLLSKLKGILGLLKFSKFGGTLLSMILSFWGYAVFYGWRFGLALVYLIFVHEMGHLLFAKIKGLKTSPALFIPFMGAVISHDRPEHAKIEAFVAYGGPFIGMLGFLPAIPLYLQTGNPFWAMMIMLGALINLFNLIPVSPLDGGRIVTVLSTKIWLIGLIICIIYAFTSKGPIIILITIFGCITWWNRMREDFKANVITRQIEALNHLLLDCKNFKHDLFRVYQDEEGKDVIEENGLRIFEIGKLEQKHQQFVQALQSMKKSYVPFIQDQQKLKKAAIAIELELTDLRLNTLRTESFSQETLEEAENAANLAIQKLEEELKTLKTYYKTDAKTKWTYLFMYVFLVVCLSLLNLYGTHLSEAARTFIK